MNKVKKVVCILAVVVLMSATVFCVCVSAAPLDTVDHYDEVVSFIFGNTTQRTYLQNIQSCEYHYFFYLENLANPPTNNGYYKCLLLGIGSNSPIKFLTNGNLYFQRDDVVSYSFFVAVGPSGPYDINNNSSYSLATNVQQNNYRKSYSGDWYYLDLPIANGSGYWNGQLLLNGVNSYPLLNYGTVSTPWHFMEGSTVLVYNAIGDTKPIKPTANPDKTFESEYGNVYSGQLIPSAVPEGSQIGDIFNSPEYQDNLLGEGESVYSWLNTDDIPTMDLWTAYKEIFLNTETLPQPIVFNLMGVDCTFLDPRWLTENGVLLRTLMQALVVFYFLEWLFDSVLSLVGSARTIKKTYEMPEVGLDFGDLDLTDEAWDPDTFSPEELEIALDVEDSFDFYYDD